MTDQPTPPVVTNDRLREFIVGELGWRGPELTDDYPLIENRVIDSLGLFRVVSFLETDCGIRIGDREVVPANFATLTAIAEMARRAR